jgi:hypothetical protein
VNSKQSDQAKRKHFPGLKQCQISIKTGNGSKSALFHGALAGKFDIATAVMQTSLKIRDACIRPFSFLSAKC